MGIGTLKVWRTSVTVELQTLGEPSDEDLIYMLVGQEFDKITVDESYPDDDLTEEFYDDIKHELDWEKSYEKKGLL